MQVQVLAAEVELEVAIFVAEPSRYVQIPTTWAARSPPASPATWSALPSCSSAPDGSSFEGGNGCRGPSGSHERTARGSHVPLALVCQNK